MRAPNGVKPEGAVRLQRLRSERALALAAWEHEQFLRQVVAASGPMLIEGSPAVRVHAKDEKNLIPYAVLKAERKKSQKLAEEVERLRAEVTQAQAERTDAFARMALLKKLHEVPPPKPRPTLLQRLTDWRV